MSLFLYHFVIRDADFGGNLWEVVSASAVDAAHLISDSANVDFGKLYVDSVSVSDIKDEGIYAFRKLQDSE